MLSLPFQTIIVANEVDQPRSERLELSTKSGPRSWDFWVMPERGSTDLLHGVERHASVSKELGQRLFPDSDLAVTTGSVRNGRAESGVVIARSLDLALVDYLEAGGRVLLLPDGNPGSFVTRTYPFSSPGLVIGNHPSIRRVPYRALLNTIRRDLGSSMVPDLPILGQVELIILIGELGDDQRVNTHGLVFQMTVGKGRLLVSALKHDHSAIGGYLLDEFVIHLATGLLPRCGLAPAEIETFRRRIRAGENLSF